VWPEADHDTRAGRLILWVGDRPMAKTRPTSWPLLKHGIVDLFAPFVIGVDPRPRRHLDVRPRCHRRPARDGQTFLDPTVELHAYDLKGGSDLRQVGAGWRR